MKMYQLKLYKFWAKTTILVTNLFVQLVHAEDIMLPNWRTDI